jgi:signal peptidase I
MKGVKMEYRTNFGLCSPDLLSQIYVGLNNDTNPFYIYESESMAPILHKGDLIVANYNNTNFNDSKFGDIIIFKATDPAERPC